ncbi:hypothetical protein FRC03_004933 [Tulasnella sp. 419]|nr:hypothetical protein FRC03_004933 [Tulasnella sp. 419]
MRHPQTTRWESVVNRLLMMPPQSKDDLTTFDGVGNKVAFSFELIEKRIMEEAFQANIRLSYLDFSTDFPLIPSALTHATMIENIQWMACN